MTVNELQKIIDYVGEHRDSFKFDIYDENKKSVVTVPGMPFEEFMNLLAHYPVEEPTECCKPNYEAMYNDLVTKVESQRAEIKGLKNEKCILEHKLDFARGAIAMVETIYGRRWSPGTSELIR